MSLSRPLLPLLPRILLLGLGLAVAGAVRTEPLEIRLPEQAKAEFRGTFSHERAQSRAAPMMYPGGAGLAGLLVGIATHAAIVGSVRENQRKAAETEADATLQPYRVVLNELTNEALMREGLTMTRLGQDARLVPNDVAPESSAWQLHIAAPVFWFTADHRAIVLEAAMTLAPANAVTAAWQQRVRLISRPLPTEDLPRLAWVSNEGQRLKKVAAGLLSLAYELAMARGQAAPNQAGGTQKTMRFWEGAQQQIERAELLGQDDCGRALIRNLRDELLSVPLTQQATAEGCER